ncbi:GNAT family N-acetyltransferase [Acinetobacter sp. ANC 5054]|uniref:GNAT family N-acetyltransferase n=1 Tax=Acinetobacter sp. ANC 5054 TaxID=1977877 RepID=UPI000A34A30D|nr:GNAT family N-acetyltransferase [Acinetobacter sp. ANC 5054]OTG82723.1 GNAT family N-acetyltransferase [Acinetobacter sp. ANC 5054]
MTLAIEIKPLQNISKEQWMPLWQAYQIFYNANIPEHVSQNTWNKLVSHDVPQMYGFAAILNNQVVGIVHIIEHDSCWTIKPYAYLQDLFTLEEYRGQGIARKLIQHVYDIAMARKCDRVYWLTHETNEIAKLLYDRVAKKTGFIQYRM